MGAAVGLVGLAVSMMGQAKQISAQKKAEKLRERQMNLQAMRERRETIRKASYARATALSNATSQGAEKSSGLGGGYGQISGEAGRNIVAINQNQEIGKGIFKANRDYYSGSLIQGFGSAIGGAGDMMNSIRFA